MLITMDPPRHVRLRRLVNKGFTPRAVGAMEDHIRQMTTEILDDIAAKGECDFVIDVAALLPLAVICGMMGVGKKDWGLMFQLTNKVLGGGDPEYQTDVPEEQRGTIEAARLTSINGFMGMLQFWSTLLAERRKRASRRPRQPADRLRDRRRGAERRGDPAVLLPAHRRRQRDDAERHLGRPARALGASRREAPLAATTCR